MFSFTKTQETILKKTLGIPCGINIIDDFILSMVFESLKGPVKMFKGSDKEFEEFIVGSNIYTVMNSTTTKELVKVIDNDFLLKLEKFCDKFSYPFQKQAYEEAKRLQTPITNTYIIMKYNQLNS